MGVDDFRAMFREYRLQIREPDEIDLRGFIHGRVPRRAPKFAKQKAAK